MSEELAGLFADLSSDSLNRGVILQLKEQPDEELHISCRVDKMSAGTLVFRLPNLYGHCLGENVRSKLDLSPKKSQMVIRRAFIDCTSGLKEISKTEILEEVTSIRAGPSYGANWTYLQIEESSAHAEYSLPSHRDLGPEELFVRKALRSIFGFPSPPVALSASGRSQT